MSYFSPLFLRLDRETLSEKFSGNNYKVSYLLQAIIIAFPFTKNTCAVYKCFCSIAFLTRPHNACIVGFFMYTSTKVILFTTILFIQWVTNQFATMSLLINLFVIFITYIKKFRDTCVLV